MSSNEYEQVVTSPVALTPVEKREGRWYKREDLHRGPGGVNGAKYRACRHLMSRAKEAGARHVVSASSVLSPQAAMGAVLARELGLTCTIIVGGTTPEKAARHRSIAIAKLAGADIQAISVGYNPALQKAAREAAKEPGVWRLPYGITTPEDASEKDVRDFLQVGATQTFNLPDEIKTLVIPFGSGNTAAGVLYGLYDFAPESLERVILMGIGPDRQAWLKKRLETAGYSLDLLDAKLEHVALHPTFATYGDRMKETLDGIVLHPTYEGKVARFLNMTQPDYWQRRDGSTALWIVGGPV